MRGLQINQPIQDTWDELTNRVTTVFLGVQTQCISCHNGRRHLERINLYLSGKTRQDFWQLSAFFSRMNVLEQPVDASNFLRKGVISDRTTGGYNGVLADPGNPGPRPPRTGGPYDAVYLFTQERPQSGEWRKELARLVTADRQFARAAVNYLWAHFFRVGIVDPPNGWDLARIDPLHPPPEGSGHPIQPTHPELLERLADEFIANNYNLRHMIRLMAMSRAYQLSSRHPEWKAEYALYYAKSFPRRLTPEEVYDAMTKATLTPVPMFVEGINGPLTRAVQLPDPSEPRNDYTIYEFLQVFGRGNWVDRPQELRSNAVQVLYLMNHYIVNSRTFGNEYYHGSSRVAALAASNVSDDDAIKQLALATLGRLPTAEELSGAKKTKHPRRQFWLSDVQWAMLNQLEFIFNH